LSGSPGLEKAIERIEPGEMVLSLDETSGSTVPARVERTFVRADTEHLIVVNGSLVATPNHLFLTDRGWVPAEYLRPNDVLVRLRGAGPTGWLHVEAELGRVSALEMRPGSVTTYNLGVARHHDFFAGGVLVHDGP
jgi:intein/homing endonuclease